MYLHLCRSIRSLMWFTPIEYIRYTFYLTILLESSHLVKSMNMWIFSYKNIYIAYKPLLYKYIYWQWWAMMILPVLTLPQSVAVKCALRMCRWAVYQCNPERHKTQNQHWIPRTCITSPKYVTYNSTIYALLAMTNTTSV